MNIFSKKPFALGCFLFFISVVLGRFVSEKLVFCIAALFLLIGIISFFIIKPKASKALALIASIFICLGYIRSGLFSLDIKNNVEIYKSPEKQTEIEGIVISKKYYSSYFTVTEIITNKINGKDVNIKMIIESDFASDMRRGELVRFSGYIDVFDSDGDFDEKQYYNSKGIFLKISEIEGTCRVLKKDVRTIEIFFAELNLGMSGIITKDLDSKASALTDAVFLGNKTNLGEDIKRNFRRTGTYHVLALSGLHLSVLSAILDIALMRLGAKKGLRYIFLPILLTFYVAVTGFSISVIRSAIMLFLTYVAYWAGKRKDSLTSLMIAASLIVFVSPETSFDISFLLSVSSTFGIIILTPFSTWVRFKMRRIANRSIRKTVSYVLSSFITSFSATLFVLPFSCFYFDGFSFIGAIMTLVVSPFISLILIISPLLFLFSKISFISLPLSFCLQKVCDFTIGTVSFASNFNKIYISLDYDLLKLLLIVFFVVLGILLIIKLKRKYIIGVFIGAFIISFFISELLIIMGSPLSAEYIVDKNNEFIIVSEKGENVIIDLSDGSYSSFERSAKPLIKGYCEIDALILTHLHQKHIATFIKIAQSQIIRNLLIPEPINQKEQDIALTLLDVADGFGINCNVYHLGKSVTVFDSQTITLCHDYIKRSTHPVLRMDFTGPIDMSYIGSSFFEYSDDVSTRENVILGTHGPVCKNKFVLQAAEIPSRIFISNSEVIEYVSLKNVNETKVFKNISYLKITSEDK